MSSNNNQKTEDVIKKQLSISLKRFSVKFIVLYFFIGFIILGAFFLTVDWFVFKSITSTDEHLAASRRIIFRARGFRSEMADYIYIVVFQIVASAVCAWYTAVLIKNKHFKNKSKKISRFIESENDLVSQFNLLNKLKVIKIKEINVKVPIFLPKITFQNYESNNFVNDERLYLTRFNFEWNSFKFTIIFNNVSYMDKHIRIKYKIIDLNKDKLLAVSNTEHYLTNIVATIDDKWITLKNLSPFVTKRIKNNLYTKMYGFDAIGDDFYSSTKLSNNFQENNLKNFYEIPGIWFYQKEYMPEFHDFLKNKILYELELINEIMKLNYGDKPTYVEKV